MNNVIHFQPNTSLVIDTNIIQRTVYFTLGFGLIITAMASPPVTTTWFATINLLGILGVLMAILGKRIIPVLEGTGVPVEPRVMTNTSGLLLGIGVSVLAIAHPPVDTAWIAFAHLVAIVLVTKAILGYNFLMKDSAAPETGDASFPTNDEKHSSSGHLPKAA